MRYIPQRPAKKPSRKAPTKSKRALQACSPNRDEPASGAVLDRLVDAFLDAVTDWAELRVTTEAGPHLAICYALCRPFQGLLNILRDRGLCAQLSHQHNVILRFWNRAHFGGRGQLEVRHRRRVSKSVTRGAGKGTEARKGQGIIIQDLVEGGTTHQLKTGNSVTDEGAAEFLLQHLPAIRRNAASVHCWWLAFLRKLAPPKSRKGRPCYSYLVLIEVRAGLVRGVPRDVLATEVVQLVQQAQARVKREDDIDNDGFLLPVKNVWVVEALKEEIAEKDQENAALRQHLAEKDQLLAEKNQENANLRQHLAELRKRLGEP